jgi:signal transduction histidine kinase
LVSNTFAFPDLALDPGSGLPAFLIAPAPRTHAVQFYDEEKFLFDTVGKFLSAGLSAQDRLIVIATEAHVDGFLQHVDPRDLERARDEQRITVLDARAVLSQLMVGDMPDPRRFQELVGDLTGSPSRNLPPARVRAYGEMVDLLARGGNIDAAVRLEEMWHAVLEENPFSLLCAYLMGTFVRQSDRDRLPQVFASHSHVIPTEGFVGLSNPEQRLREIARLQQRERLLESEVERRQKLQHALDDALSDLGLLEKQLLIALEKEHILRRRAESSDAFKERFLGILGHDLRNPLNTILTTVRMMARRKDLAPENGARLERVAASSVRMQRMIEQLLDVAQARLPDGIQVRPDEARDLAQLVTNLIAEIGASSPSRTIELVASPCLVRVDVERFEQALWSLLSYTVAHSDAARPIRVELAPRDAMAVLTVCTSDQTIDPALLPALLDSFHLEMQPEVGIDGLALGLYLAKRIVVAHGGSLEAYSSEETGTTLEAILALA